MQIGIFYNENQVAREIVEQYAAEIEKGGGSAVFFSAPEQIWGCDRLIVLGGDGTVLKAAKAAAPLGIPLFGVNYGRIGFLTEFEKEEREQAVALALNEACPRMRRSMLETTLCGKTHVCLNELALLRGISPESHNRVEKITVAVDGTPAGDYACDGLIVATPTGSTAYSLSAGGCIMMPDCETFLLTPVCAFSLRSRPIVFPDTSELTLSLSADDALMAYGDGDFLGVVGEADKLTVKKSALSAVLLTRNEHGFFARLSQKIN